MSTDTKLELDGLDGSNPLAFLAALGTMRSLDRTFGDGMARLGWSARRAAWRPLVVLPEPCAPDAFVKMLDESLRGREDRAEFDLGHGENNLSVEPGLFSEFLVSVTQDARLDDRETADFGAAFGSEAALEHRGTKPRIRDTALRTMSGSGWQHFLGNMRSIIAATKAEHLEKALFEEWRYDDPLKGLSMRWEPTEDRRHAYQWNDPTDSRERDTGSMLGANRLAIEALPFFPTVPINRPGGSTRLETVGFRRTRRGQVEWTWPIWEPALSSRIIRSLLNLQELAKDSPRPTRLRPRGVVSAFRSTRISVDYFRNFTPAVSV